MKDLVPGGRKTGSLRSMREAEELCKDDGSCREDVFECHTTAVALASGRVAIEHWLLPKMETRLRVEHSVTC